MPSVVLFTEHEDKGFLWDLRAELAHACNRTAEVSYAAQCHRPLTGIGDGWLTRPGSSGLAHL